MIRSSLGQKSDKPLSPSIPSIDPYCANLCYRPSTSNAAKCLQLRDLQTGARSRQRRCAAPRPSRSAARGRNASDRTRALRGSKAPTAVASGASGNLAAQGRGKDANHRLSLPTLAADRLPKWGKGSDQVKPRNLAAGPGAVSSQRATPVRSPLRFAHPSLGTVSAAPICDADRFARRGPWAGMRRHAAVAVRRAANASDRR